MFHFLMSGIFIVKAFNLFGPTFLNNILQCLNKVESCLLQHFHSAVSVLFVVCCFRVLLVMGTNIANCGGLVKEAKDLY